jgi:hypothetical protein
MGKIISRSAHGCAVLLLAAVACLASGIAFASTSQTCPPPWSSTTTYQYGQVVSLTVSRKTTNYQSLINSNLNKNPTTGTTPPSWAPTGAVLCQLINIQPIDVCASTATSTNPVGCAPFNSVTQNPNPWTSTGPIGFVDPATGTDLTRAMWNKIGVDIHWLPITPYPNGTYLSVPITCTLSGNECTEGSLTSVGSGSLQALTQQNCTPTVPGALSGPCLATGSAPTAPLNLSPYALNMFFIQTLVPPVSGGTLYGVSWLCNNGIAIASNTFFPPSLFVGGKLVTPPPRYDTLAHEIGHNHCLDHLDKYNFNTSAPALDLITAGSSRTEPSSTSNALSQLSSGTADVLEKSTSPNASPTTCPSTTPPTPCYQQDQVLDPVSFLNPIANSTTRVSALAPTKTYTPIQFDFTGPTQIDQTQVRNPPVTLIGLVVAVGSAYQFNNKFTFTANGSLVKGFTDQTGHTGHSACPTLNTNCLLFTVSGLPGGQDLIFSAGVQTTGGQPVALADLQAAGLTITYQFSDGLIITSAVGPVPIASSPLTFFASSQQPSPPPTIDTALFTPFYASNQLHSSKQPPCKSDSNGKCPPTDLPKDADPATEGGQPPQLSCVPASSLSALLQPPATTGGPSNVIAYVPNGNWNGGSNGVRVVQLEPQLGAGPLASISTPNVVNSCASNSVTGQTVCTANTKDVYLLSGTTLNSVLTSSATGSGVNFSDNPSAGCKNCGVVINPTTNPDPPPNPNPDNIPPLTHGTAAITMGSGSGTAIQLLNLKNNTFSSPVRTANAVSEGVLWDPTRNLQLQNGTTVLAPNVGIPGANGVILSPGEAGIYDLFDISSSATAEYAHPPLANAKLDSAVEDCTTGIALASNESSNALYIADLTQATFSPGSPGSWTAGMAQMSVTIPEFASSVTNFAGITGMAVAPGSHLAIIAGENGDNTIGVLRLTPGGSESVNCTFAFPNGACAIADYAVASLPPIPPNGPNWAQALGPHGVTAYPSPNDGQAYALLANFPPTSVAVIDLQALITAPRTSCSGENCVSHTVDQDPTSFTYVDLVASGIVRFVPTGN